MEFKCMLAHPLGKKEWDKNSFVQPKLDGVRCYITRMERSVVIINLG